MKNIQVMRFNSADANVQGIIEPEDKSWAVTINADDSAVFWRRRDEDGDLSELEGQCRRTYVDVELPGYTISELNQNIEPNRVQIIDAADPTKKHTIHHEPWPDDVKFGPFGEPWPERPADDPFDFRVNEFVDDQGNPTGTFIAHFSARSIACIGNSEHEAIRQLMTYVVKLAVAGCLDHTGLPMPGNNRHSRRYTYAFPERIEDGTGEGT